MRPFPFCPFCRETMQTRRIPPDEGPERRVCSACGFIQWGNAKASASGIVVNPAGLILFARRGVEPFRGQWDIPGGFLEESEHPEDGVRREMREETGLQVVVERFVGVYMDTYGDSSPEHTLNLYYRCRVAGGQEKAADDAAELVWFAPDALPSPIGFANARAALQDFLAQGGISAQQ